MDIHETNEYILGIDIGTSSCKSVLYTLDGTAAASASCAYPTYYGKNGEAEQEAKDWWDAVCLNARTIVRERPGCERRIAAIGIDSQGSVMLPLSSSGETLERAMLWMDRRSGEQCAWINRHITQEKLSEINGNHNDPGNVAPKILWYKEKRPELYEKTAVIHNATGYIVYKMTGEHSCNRTEAGLTQLYDGAGDRWSEELISAHGLKASLFPRLYDSFEIVGRLTAGAAESMGLVSGIPVVAGAMDATASTVGCGATENGQAVVTGGTVTGIALCSDRFVRQNIAHVYRHVVPNTWLYCSSVDFGGGSLRWLKEKLLSEEKECTYAEINEAAKKVRPGSEELLFLPYMVGQRCPEWDSSMTGVWFGLKPYHGTGHLIRSVMEGTAFGVRKIAELMEEAGLSPERLSITGGCANSELWLSIFADVLQRKVYRLEQREAAVAGAMMVAGVGVGAFADFREAVASVQAAEIESHPENFEIYDELYAVFQKLYPALKEPFRELASVRENGHAQKCAPQ